MPKYTKMANAIHRVIPVLDKMSSQMLYRYILILSEGIPEDEAANYIGYPCV